MRAFALLLALAVVAGLAFGTYLLVSALAARRARRQRHAARWAVRHYGAQGETVVAASLTTSAGTVLDEHVVARIPTGAADWSERFVLARELAEERTFHLNAQAGGAP